MAKSTSSDQDRLIAALAYALFFLPILATPNSKFGKFHANQGLMLLILAMAVSAIGSAIPIIGWFIILPFGWLLVTILFLVGFVNALAGKQKPLPIIGNFSIIQ